MTAPDIFETNHLFAEDDEDDPEDIDNVQLPDPVSDAPASFTDSLYKRCMICGAESITGLCKNCSREANDRVIKTEIELPPDHYAKAEKLVSCALLGEKNRAKGIFRFGNKDYVIIGACFGPKETSKLYAHEIIPASLWKGESYTYDQLTFVNGSGGPFHSNRERFTCNGSEWVILPDQQTIFKQKYIRIYKQGSLF